MPLSLALDLGTTSTAAVAVDVEGRLVQVIRREHEADVAGLPAGHAEQNPARHLQTAVDVLRELSERLNDQPMCLGLTGQMHSTLLVDGRRQPLSNLITWQDRRANESIGDGPKSYLDEYLSRCDETAMANTGCRLSPGYAAVSAFVLQQRGEIPKAHRQLSLLADWVAAELTDAPIVTDRSNAASTGVFNLHEDCWSRELISAGGLDGNWFPDVVESGTRVGGLSERMAAATRLPAGLPIITPIGDNQASVLGSVPQGEPGIQITIGTGGQINWPVDSFVRAPGMDTRPLPFRRMMLVGAGLAGGDAYAWVNRTVRRWLAAFHVEPSSDEVYAVLNQLADAVPASADGLICEPYFRGTRREPLRRGTLKGIDSDNLTPGHLARAVMEGIATGLHGFWLTAGDGYRPHVERIIGCGNGLERNPPLARIISETFNLPILFPQHGEAAAYGAALLAGVGSGMWGSLEEAGAGIVLEPRSP